MLLVSGFVAMAIRGFTFGCVGAFFVLTGSRVKVGEVKLVGFWQAP